MGITDEVLIFGHSRSQYQQVGNAVCPPVARAIAECILECLYTESQRVGEEDNKRKRVGGPTPQAPDSAKKPRRRRSFEG